MPIEIFKPPYYKPRLPIGGGGGTINIPAPEGSGIPEIAKIIAAGMERRQQRELEERKFALTEKYREAQISALGQRGQVSGQESLDKLYEYRRGLPEGSPAEQLIDKLIQKETAALAGEQGLDIENIPATPGVLASGQWNPFKENIAAIPPTEATQRLVPRAAGPPAPKRVTPGLEGIIKGTFDKEEPKAEKLAGEKEKPTRAGIGPIDIQGFSGEKLNWEKLPTKLSSKTEELTGLKFKKPVWVAYTKGRIIGENGEEMWGAIAGEDAFVFDKKYSDEIDGIDTTMLHESIHSILTQNGIELPEKELESIVDDAGHWFEAGRQGVSPKLKELLEKAENRKIVDTKTGEPADGKVKMTRPDGKSFNIAKSEVKEAKKHGWKVAK